jgi:hypothetical protein
VNDYAVCITTLGGKICTLGGKLEKIEIMQGRRQRSSHLLALNEKPQVAKELE